MIQSLSKQWSTLLSDNPRVRFALPLMALLVLLLVWQPIHDARASAEKERAEAGDQLERIKSLRGQDVWLDRAEESALALSALRARLPNTTTVGLAQAAIQSEMREVIRALGEIPPPQIRVEEVANDALPDGVIQIRASLSAGIPPRKAFDAIGRLESTASLTRIESAEVRGGLNPGMQLVFSRFFQLDQSEETR